MPAIVAGAGDHAASSNFFAATIRNKTSAWPTGASIYAILKAVRHAKSINRFLPKRHGFFAWVERHKIGQLVDIEPLRVAASVEALQTQVAKPTVKQHLAAIRMCFDWLVTGGVPPRVSTAPPAGRRAPRLCRSQVLNRMSCASAGSHSGGANESADVRRMCRITAGLRRS